MTDKAFPLETSIGGEMKIVHAFIRIVGKEPKDKPYVVINSLNNIDLFILDKDLKRFAKALNNALNIHP